MRAYGIADEGMPPGFIQVVRPVPGAGEVLVRITWSSLNPHDASVRSGEAARYLTYSYPVVLGSDFAGVVEELGHGVTDLQVGDRVFGLVRERVASRGSLAAAVVVPREWVARTPASVSDAEAGVLGLAALTALRCVDAIGPLGAGDVVLVNGATGGVGGYALQLLSARAVHAIATAHGDAEVDYVMGLGAAETVDWREGDLPSEIASRHPSGIHAVIDLVTAQRDELTRLVQTVARPGARVASTRHAVAADDLPEIQGQNLQIELDVDALARIATLAGGGHLRAGKVSTFELDHVDDAFEALSSGALGKIAVRVALR